MLFTIFLQLFISLYNLTLKHCFRINCINYVHFETNNTNLLLIFFFFVDSPVHSSFLSSNAVTTYRYVPSQETRNFDEKETKENNTILGMNRTGHVWFAPRRNTKTRTLCCGIIYSFSVLRIVIKTIRNMGLERHDRNFFN